VHSEAVDPIPKPMFGRGLKGFCCRFVRELNVFFVPNGIGSFERVLFGRTTSVQSMVGVMGPLVMFF
jgi:hypothetical protein